MRKKALLILLFIVNLQLLAQQQVGIQHERVRVDTEFSIDKLYNKKTGKKISQKELNKLVEQNPNLPLERVYDNEGNIIKYYYNPDNTSSLEENNYVEEGAYYPELVFKTIDGKTIKLKDLRGKMVILRFEMDADTFRFKKHEIEEIDQKINATQRQSEIAAIIIFDASKQQIKKGFNISNSNFNLVPNGYNFQRKMKINRFPNTIVLDKKGRLLEEFPMSEGINIQELLNKS